MALTVVYETAEIVTRDGVQQFKLNGICTNKGDLFDKSLFLLTIVANNDPTEDIFKRLCTIGDFDEYKADRDAAVQAGDTYFRSGSFTVFLDDVDVAAEAKTALNDRIDLLATGYATYIADFKDTGHDYTFPIGVVTALEALIEAYYTAWKEYDTKKRAYDDAIVIEGRLTTDFVNAQNRLNVLFVWGNLTEDRMQHLYEEMNTASGALNTIVPQALSAADAMQAYIEEFNKGSHPMGLFGVLHDDNPPSHVDYTAEINESTANDVPLTPAAGLVDDAFFFGSDVRFKKIDLNIGTSGVGDWVLSWEYWNGVSWQTLSDIDDGSNNFRAAPGWHDITFAVQADWEKTALPGVGINAYWVKARIGALTVMNVAPLGTQAWLYNADSEFGASYVSHVNLDDDLEILEDAKNDLLQNREMALLAVTAAAAGVANHLKRQGEMTTLIGEYSTAKDTAQTTLTDATAAKLTAEKEKDVKYTALTDAYDEVRAVQSDWIPDAWFPYPP